MMVKTLWTNATLYTPDGVIANGQMLVGGDGRIEAVGPQTAADAPGAVRRDAGGALLLPGLIDVHNHGGFGAHTNDARLESLQTMSRYHAANGTTAFLPTTNTDEAERIEAALRTAARAMEREHMDGADIAGIHLEGPFLSVSKRGAQRKEHLMPPTPSQRVRFYDAAEGKLKLATIAPEIEYGMDAVEWFAARGVTVSIGHSNATYDEAMEAVRRGARHTTHHFNGMSALHHREPGVTGAGLSCDDLTIEIIADGHHVHPAVIKAAFAAKTPQRVCLITDSVDCAGLPDGEYGSRRMADGIIKLIDSDTLAGSALTAWRGLCNTIRYTGLSLEAVLPSFTSVPARQAGIGERKGTLAAGMDADFILVSPQLELLSTHVRGRVVYESQAD